jgi:hypothetical protein
VFRFSLLDEQLVSDDTLEYEWEDGRFCLCSPILKELRAPFLYSTVQLYYHFWVELKACKYSGAVIRYMFGKPDSVVIF